MDTRPRIPLISFCTVQLRTLCAVHSLATLCLSTSSGPDPGEFFGFWGFMVFRHALITRKGSGNNNNMLSYSRIQICCNANYASAMILTDSSGLYQEASNRFGKGRRVRSMTRAMVFHKLQAYNHYICYRKLSRICYLTHYT